MIPVKKSKNIKTNPIKITTNTEEKRRKRAVTKKAKMIARDDHSIISQVIIRLKDDEHNVLIAISEEPFEEDQRVYSRMAITSIASDGSDMQTGQCGTGAHQGFEFIESLDLEYYAKESARIAKTMLHADPAPSGKFPVIVDNEFG